MNFLTQGQDERRETAHSGRPEPPAAQGRGGRQPRLRQQWQQEREQQQRRRRRRRGQERRRRRVQVAPGVGLGGEVRNVSQFQRVESI